jgi:DNA polymerase III epsilon subunit-like protein
MANVDFIVFDMETGGKNPHNCQPTQLAAIAIDGRRLTPKGVFNSEIRAIIDDEKAIAAGLGPIEDEALKVTGKTRDGIAKAPDLKIVWGKFVSFVEQYNYNGSSFFAPIPVGYNIVNYDMIIVNRLCKEFGPFDEKRNSQKLFNQIYKIDMLDNVFMWTENDLSVKSRSMDAMRERMGLSKENAHDALQDVKDTANIFLKFLRTHRTVAKNLKIDGAFNEENLYIK